MLPGLLSHSSALCHFFENQHLQLLFCKVSRNHEWNCHAHLDFKYCSYKYCTMIK